MSVGFSIQNEAMDVAQSTPQGSLTCGRYLLAPLTGNKEGGDFLMVLRVRFTPTGFPTNSLYISMDNTVLQSTSSMCHPWGMMLLFLGGKLLLYSCYSLCCSARKERWVSMLRLSAFGSESHAPFNFSCAWNFCLLTVGLCSCILIIWRFGAPCAICSGSCRNLSSNKLPSVFFH